MQQTLPWQHFWQPLKVSGLPAELVCLKLLSFPPGNIKWQALKNEEKRARETQNSKNKEGRPLMPNKIKIQKSKWWNEKLIPPPLPPKIHHICLIPIFQVFFIRNWHYRYIGNTIHCTEFSYSVFFDMLWLQTIYWQNLPTTVPLYFSQGYERLQRWLLIYCILGLLLTSLA